MLKLRVIFGKLRLKLYNDPWPGRVASLYLAWEGGYPYTAAPLYGARSGLPASTSWAQVVTDNTDPMCMH